MSINTNTTPTMSAAPRRFGRNALLVAIGGGAVLGAVVVAGLWARSDSRETTAPAEAVAVQPSFNPATAPVAVNPSLKSPDMVWVYIVGSEAEAAALRTAAASVPGSPSQVIVLGSSADAKNAASWLLSLNSVRAEAGQPEVRVLVVGSLANAQ
jgi:hypothetical protein